MMVAIRAYPRSWYRLLPMSQALKSQRAAGCVSIRGRVDESLGPIESLTSIKSEGVVAETAVPEQAS